MKKKMKELKRRLEEISHLGSIMQLVSWDQEVNMPPKAADIRAESLSHLSAVIHNKFISIDHDGILSRLHDAMLRDEIKGADRVIVYEVWRSWTRERKLPEEYVRELSSVCSKAQSVWAKARKESDFKLFAPWLQKIVRLKRREAEYVGYEASPYDALLDAYEPGMTASEVEKVFRDFKAFLIPFLKEIRSSKIDHDYSRIKGDFALEDQKRFNSFIAKSIGFDFEAGRMDVSTHPFASGPHPYDVRLTTRYRAEDLFYSLGSTIHETGHGLYEQGLPAEHFGTPLAESISLGIHESQSRMWENIIGKSLPFWRYFYPRLRKEFPMPFKKIPLQEFYKIINRVEPSLIRTEADEVTYNLHIILRFEIEKGLMEGKIKVPDLPRIWNAKMREYLGLKVPSDSLGVLQDVHWSTGGIGYFPTYSLGNLYSAQIFASLKKDIPDLEKKIAKGRFEEITAWLRKHIHSQGKRQRARDLIKAISGDDLSSRYWNEYISEKYSKIYGSKKK